MLNSLAPPLVSPNKPPNQDKNIDLTGDDASAALNNTKLSNATLASTEEDSTKTSSGKDDNVVNAGVVAEISGS